MTVPSATDKVTYTGAGSTATYPYTWKIFDDDDLVVKVKLTSTLVETTLTKTTDYTVSSVGVSAGGNVVLVDADQAWLDGSGFLLSTYTITIYRSLSIIQETSITSQSSYLPELHEKQFDKLIMIDQQQQRKIDQCLKLPDTETGTAAKTTYPNVDDRAGKGSGWDSDGNPTAYTLTTVGAPTDASYICVANSGSLGSERRLQGTANQVILTDGGANGDLTLSTPQSIGTGSSVTFANVTDSALTAGRVVVAGTAGILASDSGLTYDTATDILTVAGAVKLTPAAAPASANGNMWSDSTQIATAARTGGMTEYVNRCIYSQVTNVTVANTGTATTLLTTPAFGTNVIAANYLTVGKLLRLRAWGSFGITGTPTLVLTLTQGGGGIVLTQITTAAAAQWTAEFMISVTTTGASGASDFGGIFQSATTTGGSNLSCIASPTASTVDTTIAQTFGLTVTWGAASASNTITCNGVTIEVVG